MMVTTNNGTVSRGNLQELARNSEVVPQDLEFRQAARKLWRGLRKIVDPADFWQAADDGSGPYRQNTFRNPRPIVLKNGLRRPREMTLAAFMRHLTSRRAILMVNRPNAARWLVRVDVDAGDWGPRDSTLHLARRINKEVLGRRGWVARSRTSGAGIYLLLDLTAVAAAERAGTVRRFAERLVRRYPRDGSGAYVEAVKGAREPLGANLLYDPERAAEKRRRNPFFPAEHAVNARPWGFPKALADHYDFYANHYEEEFCRDDSLEPYTEARFDQHSTVLAPCVFHSDETDAQRLENVVKCARWLDRATPLTPPELLSQARSVGELQDERIASLLAMGEEDEEISTDRPGSARVWEMIRNEDKLCQTNGIAFLTLQIKGRFDEAFAHHLYEQHVGGGRPRDRQRDARLRQVGRRAERRYRGGRMGSPDGLGQAADRPEWFTESDIWRTISRLKNMGIEKRELGAATWRVVAITYLTLRKNIWQFHNSRVSDEVRLFRDQQAKLRTTFGQRPLSSEGVPVPQRAISAMLSYFGVRNNGSAIADALRLLIDRASAIKCTCDRYQAGPVDEDGHRLGPGYCRQYALGPRELVSDGGAGGASPISLAHFVCSPEPPLLMVEDSPAAWETAIRTRRDGRFETSPAG